MQNLDRGIKQVRIQNDLSLPKCSYVEIQFFKFNMWKDVKVNDLVYSFKKATVDSEWDSEHLSTSDYHSSDIIQCCLFSEKIHFGDQLYMLKNKNVKGIWACMRAVWVVHHKNDEEIFGI